MAYNLHDLKIEGIEIGKVLACNISGIVSEHTTIVLNILIEDEDSENKLMFEVSENTAIKLFFDRKEIRKYIFQGILTDIHIDAKTDVKYAVIIAKSYSYLLDIKKKSRSFQDINMKYSTLFSQILAEYGAKYHINIEDKAIGEIKLQYEETDWEFIKRTATELSTFVSSISENEGVSCYIGLPKLEEHEIEYTLEYSTKDMATYYYLKANGEDVKAIDYSKFNISSYEVLNLCEIIKIKRKPFIIYSYTYDFSGNEMFCKYDVQAKAGIKTNRIYPRHITGIALEGEVINVMNDMVQVYFNIDKERINETSVSENKKDSIIIKNNEQKKLIWFPYSTIAASTDGTGWYYMPEIGDLVKVYFPGKHLSQAIALSSVSNYKIEDIKGIDKMKNSETIYLSTKNDQALIISESGVRLSSKGSYVSLNESGNLKIRSNAIGISAKENINISANKINMTGDLSINAKEAGLAIKKETSSVGFSGSKVFIN